jgi:2-(1,2-epoxy-1,2-dihydrophenyl)acetyl-CoA isomerase
MSSLLITERSGGVLTLRFNRPDKFNSFVREMALALQDALDEARDNAEIRAVRIIGSGKAFCAGQDLVEATAADGPSLSRIVSEHYNPIILKMRDLSLPIVCAVNGVAAGAGANIALAGDVVVAAESASFIQAFSKIGLIPDSGGTYTLPRLVGFQKASALMMLGDKVSAQEAEKMGMIYKVFSDETLEEESMKLASKLALMPTKALAFTKAALNYSMSNDLKKQLELEDALQTRAGHSHDYQEGVQAFLEKRSPNFKGE